MNKHPIFSIGDKVETYEKELGMIMSEPFFDADEWWARVRIFAILEGGTKVFWGPSKMVCLDDCKLDYSPIEQCKTQSYK